MKASIFGIKDKVKGESVMGAGFGTSVMMFKQSTGNAHNSNSVQSDVNDE